MCSMKESLDFNNKGKYIGSVSTPFPKRQWFRHSFLRSCLILFLPSIMVMSAIIIPNLDSFKYNLFLWYVGTIGMLFISTYPALFRAIVRVDFYQEEIMLCVKVLYFNVFYMIRMRRKGIVSELKSPSCLTLKDIFDPIGRSKPFELSDKNGWDKDSLSIIHSQIRKDNTTINDSSLLHLVGSYIGTIETSRPRYKLILYTFIPRFSIAFSISYLILSSTEWYLILLMTGILLVVYYELFVIIERIDVNDGELFFYGTEQVIGTSRGYIVNTQKVTVKDTFDVFHIRMLKIKEEGSIFPICLSKRQGWTDEKLDEVKEVISQLKHKNK